MANLIVESSFNKSNPIDIAEQIIIDKDWRFDRTMDDELVAEISGKWCNYQMWLTWQPDLEGMMFSCAYDVKVPSKTLPIYQTIAMANERLWLGHFDICSEDNIITFRHGTLLKNNGNINHSQIEELVDIALQECEKFYPAFQSVLWGGQSPKDAIKFSMLETFGEA